MTQTDDVRQVVYFEGIGYVPLSVYEALKGRAFLYRQQARQAEEKSAELGSELYTIQELVANPNLTDKAKIYAIGYLQWYNESRPARESGARYYNAQEIAARLGGPRTDPNVKSPKEQAIYPLHTKFKNAGLIVTTAEPQKHNKAFKNQFDVISPQFTLAARHIALESPEKSANRGGHRVPLHRECGGLCVERTTYSCLKCGHIVPKDHVLMIAEEKWKTWEADIIPCPDCEEGIPRSATFCPHCGCQQGLAGDGEPTLEIPTPDAWGESA